MSHGRVSRGTTLDALALDKPLTRSERQLAKQASTGDAGFDAIVKDVKVLHQIRDMRATDTKGKWERVLPQGRDAAGTVCVSKRGVRRAAVTPWRSDRQVEQLNNLVTGLRRRRYDVLMRWFYYWVLCRSPMSDSPDFNIIVDNEDIPIYSRVSVRLATRVAK